MILIVVVVSGRYHPLIGECLINASALPDARFR